MNIKFRGWKREVKAHAHKVVPVQKNASGNFAAQPAGPVAWTTSRKALGKLRGLGLSGDFLVEFEFDDVELRSWLLRMVDEKPATALPLLAEMQARAILALHKQPHIADTESE